MQVKIVCCPIRHGFQGVEDLLGFKKVCFGNGKYTGFGGSVERFEMVEKADMDFG